MSDQITAVLVLLTFGCLNDGPTIYEVNMDVWRGEERREHMVNQKGKTTSLHDDVVRLIERVDNCLKALVVVVPLLLAYEVWEYQRVSRIDATVALINARGSVFLAEKVNKHHADKGCHFDAFHRN